MTERSWVIPVVVLVISLLYALSMFPGLEYHSAYFGHTYKALHPESFPGDKYMPADSPSGRSSYYWLARMVGDLWLDDRFTILLFFLLVTLALVGVDKTVQTFGVHPVEDRVALLSLMAMGHRFRDNFANLVENADFYAGTFAGVAAIWLFYFLFSETRFWKQGLCMILLWSLTPRWAWFPILITLTLLYQERLRPSHRRLVNVAVPLLLAAGYGVYYFWIRPPNGTHALLFDYLRQMENSEVHPFLDRPIGNLKYFLLTGLGIAVTPAVSIQARRIRVVAVLGILLWLLGGIYLSYAPNFLKIPYLVPFAFNRALQWPQYLLFLSVSAGALQRIRSVSSLQHRILYLAVLMTLYATFFFQKILIMALVWVTFLIFSKLILGRPASQLNWVRISACAFLLVTLVAYGARAYRRAPDLKFLVRNGVIGDNPSAKWVGVDEFVRKHTPFNAVILPIATRDYPWRPGVKFEGSLRVRTGRTMPVGSPWPVLFKYELLKSLDAEGAHINSLISAWKKRDPEAVRQEFNYFKSLGYNFDYLVVENSEADWVRDGKLNYQVEKIIGNFTVLRRQGFLK